MRIDHTALAAEDPVGLSAWYARWFDLREEQRLESRSRPAIIFLLDDMGQRIEIVPGVPSLWAQDGRFAPHVAFSTRDLDRDVGRLEGAGIRVLERRTTSAGWRIAYFYDPAGNLLEMVERSEKRHEGGQR